MNIEFTKSAWDNYLWFQANDRKLLKRMNQLIKETSRTPFEGTGKPNPLKPIYPAIGQDESILNIVLFIVWLTKN